MLILAALGCGGGSSNPNTFNGLVHGQPMTPADAVSSPAHVSVNGIAADVAAVALTNVANVCSKVTANMEPRNGKALLILLADVSVFAVTAPTAPGTFNVYDPSSGGIPPAHLAVVSFGVDDASCTLIPGQSAVATSGAVRLTSISNGSYAGTYSVQFDTGEQVSGEFHATSCPGLATYLGSTTHACG
jgi:hypothetical protein